MKRTRRLATLLLLLNGIGAAHPAAAQNGAVMTLRGTDTLSFERYSRTGNVVTGSWVVMHPPGVFVHDYHILIGADGLPVRYSMVYRVPLDKAQQGLDSVVINYTRDTVTYKFVRGDSSETTSVALHEAFPFLGQSFVGLDLALRRLRAAHADTGTVQAHETSNLQTPPRRLPVRLAGDSAFVGAAMRVHLTPDGGFDDMHDGRVTVRQVPSLDVARLTKQFVDVYRPRAAAIKAAAAARKEIPLPAAQLARFVGKYGSGLFDVMRDGDHLGVAPRGQPMLTLRAMSPTEFFVVAPDLVFTFDIDAAGAVTGITLTQGEGKQKFARDPPRTL